MPIKKKLRRIFISRMCKYEKNVEIQTIMYKFPRWKTFIMPCRLISITIIYRNILPIWWDVARPLRRKEWLKVDEEEQPKKRGETIKEICLNDIFFKNKKKQLEIT